MTLAKDLQPCSVLATAIKDVWIPPEMQHQDNMHSRKQLSDFVCPEHERPTIAHNDFQGGDQTPVIDLAKLKTGDEKDRESLTRKMMEAGSEWGLFQVVNHGVPLEIMEKLQAQARVFFGLPLERKQKAKFSGQIGGYGRSPRKRAASPWMEGFFYEADVGSRKSDLREYAQLCLEGSELEEFSTCLEEFASYVDKLALETLEIWAEGLGLHPTFFTNYFREGGLRKGTRLNNYPPCPEPSLTLGLGAHADPNLLTVLLQDETGGLQVQKDGVWFTVRPRVGALIVNVADLAQGLSNGRLRSCVHRVVVNATVPRLSVAAFYTPKVPSTLISAPPELIDHHHPRLYRPFSLADHLREIHPDAPHWLESFAIRSPS